MKLNLFFALLSVTLGVSMHVNATEVNNDVVVNANTSQQTSSNQETVPANQPPEPKTTVKSTGTRETRIDNGYNEGYVYPVPVARPIRRVHPVTRVNPTQKVSPAQRATTKN